MDIRGAAVFFAHQLIGDCALDNILWPFAIISQHREKNGRYFTFAFRRALERAFVFLDLGFA